MITYVKLKSGPINEVVFTNKFIKYVILSHIIKTRPFVFSLGFAKPHPMLLRLSFSSLRWPILLFLVHNNGLYFSCYG